MHQTTRRSPFPEVDWDVLTQVHARMICGAKRSRQGGRERGTRRDSTPARPACCHMDATLPGKLRCSVTSSRPMSMPSSKAFVAATPQSTPVCRACSMARLSAAEYPDLYALRLLPSGICGHNYQPPLTKRSQQTVRFRPLHSPGSRGGSEGHGTCKCNVRESPVASDCVEARCRKLPKPSYPTCLMQSDNTPVYSDPRSEQGSRFLEDLTSVAGHQLAYLPCLAERNSAQPVLDALCQQQADLQDRGPSLVIYSHPCRAIPPAICLLHMAPHASTQHQRKHGASK